MRRDLAHGDDLLGHPVERELVEHAVGAVGLDQALDRQKRRGQRRDPQRAGADPAEQPRVGADREWHQRCDQQEKGHWQPRRAGEGAAHVTEDQRADHQPSFSCANRPEAAGATRRAPRRRRRGAPG